MVHTPTLVSRRDWLRGVGLLVATPSVVSTQQPPSPPPPTAPPAPDNPTPPPPTPEAPSGEKILTDDEGRIYRVCPQCGYNMYRQGRMWVCENCGYAYVE